MVGFGYFKACLGQWYCHKEHKWSFYVLRVSWSKSLLPGGSQNLHASQLDFKKKIEPCKLVAICVLLTGTAVSYLGWVKYFSSCLVLSGWDGYASLDIKGHFLITNWSGGVQSIVGSITLGRWSWDVWESSLSKPWEQASKHHSSMASALVPASRFQP